MNWIKIPLCNLIVPHLRAKQDSLTIDICVYNTYILTYLHTYIHIYIVVTSGTPFWFGMCCITLPWTARNIMRYQYRIDGDDFVEDCAFPTSCCLLSFIYYQLCPSCMPTLYPYPIGLMPGLSDAFCIYINIFTSIYIHRYYLLNQIPVYFIFDISIHSTTASWSRGAWPNHAASISCSHCHGFY